MVYLQKRGTWAVRQATSQQILEVVHADHGQDRHWRLDSASI